MGDLPDQAIEGKGFATDANVLPFEKPEKFKNISNDLIKSVSFYMKPVIYRATANREVDVVTENLDLENLLGELV